MTLSGLYPVRAEEEAQSTKNHARWMVQVVVKRTYIWWLSRGKLFVLIEKLREKDPFVKKQSHWFALLGLSIHVGC